MAVLFTHHVRTRLGPRGTTEREIEDVIATGQPAEARPGYLARAKVFQYDSIWEGRQFPEKRVRVIYAVDGDNEVVVTVYVYYGRWSQ